jgi:hypothetical protein
MTVQLIEDLDRLAEKHGLREVDYLLDDLLYPDPLGPHEYTPYRYEQVGPYGFLKSFMAPICGYRSCGASRLSAVHLRGV